MDMSTTDAAFGLEPWGPVLRAQLYAIATNPTNAIGRGTLMEATGTALATPKYGTLQGAIDEETGAAGTILGAVLATFDYKGDPCNYIAASETGNGTIAGYALIADHPQQLYIAQEDGDTSSLVAANIGLAADMVGSGVDSNTGRSSMEIDSDTIAGTATLALRIVNIHPDDSISAAAAAGNHARFICFINSSYYGSATVGA